MHIIGYKSHKSWDSVIVEYKSGLPFNYRSSFIRSLVGCLMPALQPLVDWIFVDIFNFDFTQSTPSTFDLLSIYLDFDLLSIHFDFKLLSMFWIYLDFDLQSIHLD